MSNRELKRVKAGTANIVFKLGDLTQETADVIVNAANNQLLAGGGVCGAIYKAAGPDVFQECQNILKNEKINAIAVGEARMTGPGKLNKLGIKAIIHAAGPQGSGEKELRAAYRNSLKLAVAAGYQSIAFPSISTGIYGYPIDKAAIAALDEITKFIVDNPNTLKEIIFVFWDESTAANYLLS